VQKQQAMNSGDCIGLKSLLVAENTMLERSGQ